MTADRWCSCLYSVLHRSLSTSLTRQRKYQSLPMTSLFAAAVIALLLEVGHWIMGHMFTMYEWWSESFEMVYRSIPTLRHAGSVVANIVILGLTPSYIYWPLRTWHSEFILFVLTCWCWLTVFQYIGHVLTSVTASVMVFSCSEQVESCENWSQSTTQQVDLAFNIFFMIYFFIRVSINSKNALIHRTFDCALLK